MTSNLQIFLIVCGGLFFLVILSLLYRNKITEKYSVLWLLGGTGILVLSGNPEILDAIAYRVGVDYPPTLLFFLSTLILLGFHLYQSMEITKLNKKLKELTQYIALKEVIQKEFNQHDEKLGGRSHAESNKY